MRRVIDQLRRLYRLTKIKWTYDPKAGVWRTDEGWHVYAGCILGGPWGDDPMETRFYRSDTGESVPVVLDSTRLRIGGW